MAEKTLGVDNLLPWETDPSEETVDEGLLKAADSLLGINPDDEPEDDGTEEDEESDSDQESDSDDADDDEEADDDQHSEEDEEDEEFDEDEEDEEGGEDEPESREIKINGEMVEVTVDEAYEGYSRTADYTRKTQALAERAREVEAIAATAAENRDLYAQRLEALKQIVAPAEPNWDQLRKDLEPAEFSARVAEHQLQREQLAKVEAEQQRVLEEQQADLAARRKVILDQEREKLLAAVPELADEKETQRLVEYATSLGFSTEDLENVGDHRAFIMLRKSMLFDELKTGRERVSEKTKGARTLKPGGKKRTTTKSRKGRRDQKKIKAGFNKLAQTHSVDDAASLIEDMLPKNL